MDLTRIVTQNVPWVVMGDFNVVVGTHEKRGGTPPLSIPIDEFVAFTDSCDLIHMDTIGTDYT